MKCVCSTDSSFVITVIRRGAQHWLSIVLHGTRVECSPLRQKSRRYKSSFRGDCEDLHTKICPFLSRAFGLCNIFMAMRSEDNDDQTEAGTSSKKIIKQKKDSVLAKKNQPTPKIPQ